MKNNVNHQEFRIIKLQDFFFFGGIPLKAEVAS